MVADTVRARFKALPADLEESRRVWWRVGRARRRRLDCSASPLLLGSQKACFGARGMGERDG
eukprot:2375401-Rhodomonas_salina.1